jgi:hypothetical protein
MPRSPASGSGRCWSASGQPYPRALRLAGALLIEQNDEWLVARRYLSAESIALALEGQGDEAREGVPELQAA